MNNTHNLPSFDVIFSGLYSGTSDLINQSCQLDARIRQQNYQGMSGQTLDSFPVYNSQSDIHNNEASIFKSLHKYDIVSLTDCNPEIAFGTGIHEIPKSVLDKYIPCSSDDELINDEISSIPNFLFTQQVSLPVNEPDPIPARHSNTDDQLPHLPAVLSNRQDLPPVALVNPANLNQTTSDKQTPPLEDMADSLPVKSQRGRIQDPEKRKLINQRQRERRQDPEKKN
ncbi:hypothetical protein [Endozoicomonas sp. SESOKO1]|uniref:hypothetical protein n=1 Tax=Endozoicomonas sp. SESOKO1 TaxID=2828742 RepID=UPI0021483FD1|nr:hypothetical protein [Endozoicomonas sp. SESOKO1]